MTDRKRTHPRRDCPCGKHLWETASCRPPKVCLDCGAKLPVYNIANSDPFVLECQCGMYFEWRYPNVWLPNHHLPLFRFNIAENLVLNLRQMTRCR